ncbi:hypothetical protein AABB24_027856 [Solanum stoloniferum]|uniref:Uncharacterized protein n=1 Tax=Solanum stoloniferum TaxID=62892 RepID=A0ABD2S4G8_9SOLN
MWWVYIVKLLGGIGDGNRCGNPGFSNILERIRLERLSIVPICTIFNGKMKESVRFLSKDELRRRSLQLKNSSTLSYGEDKGEGEGNTLDSGRDAGLLGRIWVCEEEEERCRGHVFGCICCLVGLECFRSLYCYLECGVGLKVLGC